MEQTQKEVSAHIRNGNFFIQQVVDVTDTSNIKEAYKQLETKFEECGMNRVSILLNNAGIVYDDPINSLSVQEVDNTFSVNVISQFSLISTFLPDLMNQRVANIVNMSSLIALVPSSHLSSYSASKAAVRAMSDCLRLDFKANNNDHIRVTTICPQFVSTGMFSGSYSKEYLGHRLKNFFFPENSAEDIAKEIVYAIRYEKDEIILPRLVGFFLPLLQFFPHVITDYLFLFAGGSHGMDCFEGRGKKWNESRRMERSAKESNVLYDGNTIVYCDIRK
ncbi:hypothetical protein WA577_005220 [Blastocystis sp. JDR]